jgi:DNA-directed RNA polymerase specialized sigma24 family protein
MKKRTVSTYATHVDFCRVFKSDMNRLYLLSYLLTADHSKAEQCFVSGLRESHRSNPVFKEWAQSWARRMVIANAIRIVHPRPNSSAPSIATDRTRPAMSAQDAAMLPREFADIFGLPDFDRFTFVLRVLEGYSDRECSLLLGCTVGDLSAARIRIFQQMATSANMRTELEDAYGEPAPHSPAPEYLPEAVTHLAV